MKSTALFERNKKYIQKSLESGLHSFRQRKERECLGAKNGLQVICQRGANTEMKLVHNEIDKCNFR